MTIDAKAAVIIVAGVVGLELLRLVTQYVFQKFTNQDNDYVSKTDCEECARGKDSEMSALRAEIVAIKQILLILASRAGVHEDDLKKLVGINARERNNVRIFD